MRSAIPIASAPLIVNISNASCAPNTVGSSVVLRDAGGERRGAQRVERVGCVLRIAAQRDAHAPSMQLGMAAVRGDALAEAQVRPWCVCDRGTAAHHDIALRVVEVHRVCEQHVVAERADAVEVHERAGADARLVCRGVGRRRRDMERQARLQFAREVGRATQQIVRHQVVADERDPPVDAVVVAQLLHERTLSRDHL
jgi:hypothetical protein